MNESLSHLDEEARPRALLPDEERIRDIQSPRWIGYSRARQVLERMERLLAHPPTHRMPNLLLLGDTNNGKTVIVNRFARQHTPRDDPQGERLRLPVLVVQAPPGPDEPRFYNAILEAIHAPPMNDRMDRKQFRVLHLLRQLGLRLLVIDEIHHVLAGQTQKQRYFLNVIKYLGNELQIPIVAVGIQEAYFALQNDPQLSNRFLPMQLPRWDADLEYLRLLKSFERMLPLRRASNLSEPELGLRLLALAGGTIGELSTLLRAAAILAIRTGEEAISAALLEVVDYLPPQERKWGPGA